LLTRTGVKFGCWRYAAKPPARDDGSVASGIVAAFFVAVVVFVTVLVVVMVVVALVTAARGAAPAFACHSNLPCQPQSGPLSTQSP
jgi:heme/copper-type cytochrome/quinol oxidase subunit 2